MAEPNIVTQEEMALRRRARRRLVGAVAIALAAVVVLPMVFDPEPKPLGPEVDLRIPAKDSAFEPAPAAPVEAPPAPEAAEAKAAEPTLPDPALAGSPAATPALPAVKPMPAATPALPAVKPMPAAKPDSPASAESKAAKKPEEAEKPTPKPAAKVETKAEAKVAAKADPAFASRGFFLQLGAFTNEANAKQLVEKVQAAGFKVGLNDSNGQYRVRVGPIAEHEKAMEMQARLKAKGFSPVMLGP